MLLIGNGKRPKEDGVIDARHRRRHADADDEDGDRDRDERGDIRRKPRRSHARVARDRFDELRWGHRRSSIGVDRSSTRCTQDGDRGK